MPPANTTPRGASLAEPKTREAWIDSNWGATPPVPWTIDREMEMPEELQDYSWIDEQEVDPENDYPELGGRMVGTAIPKRPKRDEPAQDKAWSVPRFNRPSLAMDRAGVAFRSEIGQPIAMDRRPSARRLSEDGHLHVINNRISKAAVNPYWGKEIPGFDKLGLDPEQKYMLLRHPKELEKAAPTFNNKPILAEHIPVSSEEHPSDLVIGSTGSDVRYEHPYLKSSLVFWPQAAIDAISSEGQKELAAHIITTRS